MMVQSPLKKHDIRPNLRKVPKPDAELPFEEEKPRRASVKASAKQVTNAFSPGKVILLACVVGIFGFMYLTHVFATQQLLLEVQQMEREYNRARRQHDALRLQYNRMVGPADIYDKAAEQGFINGGPADEVIIVKEN
ncbi:MAG: hypothetical protein AAFW89_07905 [Bacteroidota bacterium]